MNAVLIHGQNHKGASYNIGNKIIESIEDVEQKHEFFLPRDMDTFCTGCYVCLKVGEERCPHYDQIKPITRAIDDADLLVFTTPVYCMRTSGSMKALLDHYFTRWMNHRPRESMFHKKAVVVSVGAGGGMKHAARDIETSLDNWGISRIAKFHAATFAMKWNEVDDKRKQKILNKLDKFIRKVKAMGSSVKLDKKFHFYCMRLLHKINWSLREDKEYWEKKDWLGSKRPWKV